MLCAPRGEVNLLRSSSTHLHSTLHLDLDLIGWVLWRRWPGQKVSSNFLMNRRNAPFTTEKIVKLRSTWTNFRQSAIALNGLYKQTQEKIRWKLCKQIELFPFCRWSPLVDQTRKTALGTKLWKTKAVWFPALVSMLTSKTTLLNRLWGKVNIIHLLANSYLWISDLQTLTEEIYNGVKYWEKGSKEHIHATLQQMFPTSADKGVDNVKSLTESYHKYKRGYVKHLGFNPDSENLSKWYLTSESLYISSDYAGACTTGGSVHLLQHSNLWRDWEEC